MIVGYTSADDRWDVSAGQGDARYGVELQASAVSNLLGGIAIKPLRPSVQDPIILIMGAVGALIRHVLRGAMLAARFLSISLRSVASTTVHVPIPLIGAIVVHALVAFLVYKQYRLIFDISYHLASLLFMYLMVGWVQRGGREKTVAARA